MTKLITYPKIRELLEKNEIQHMKDLCRNAHPADLADILSQASIQENIFILTHLDPESAASALSHMNPDFQEKIVIYLPEEVLTRLINDMDSDDRVDLIRNMPGEKKEKLLYKLAKDEREDILKLQSYREGTAGSIMTSDYATLPAGITAKDAIKKLRLEAPDKETIYYAYIIDGKRRLLGAVSLREIIMAEPGEKIKNLMHRDLTSAKVEEDREVVARKMKKYDLLAIPVTNGNDALVGIITHDDIHDVIVEEATEDFHLFGGLAHKLPDINLNIGEAGFLTMFRKRMPWLLILVFMNIFSGAGIAYFEDAIEAVVALVFFLPLLIDSGGNAGSQSATLMVRSLAIGDIRLKDWFRLLGREVTVALALGVSMGLAVSMIGIFRAGPEVAAVVAMTMVITVLFGSLVGMSLPFLLTRFKLDPATASAPLITSIADIGGVLIYFSIASWYLKDIIAAAGGA